MLNSDAVLTSGAASFLSAYGGVGLTPDCGVSYVLPQVVGPRRAAEMSLGGAVASAQDALDWGLATELVEDADLQDRARQLGYSSPAEQTRSWARRSALLNTGRLSTYAEHLDEELRVIPRCSPPWHRGTDRILRRTPPGLTIGRSVTALLAFA